VSDKLPEALRSAVARCFDAALDPIDVGQAEVLRALERAWPAALAELAQPRPAGELPESFQSSVDAWMLACFGAEIAADRTERNHRFLEESLELVQSFGCTVGEARQIVEYVYGRPRGTPRQEVGGVLVTLAALCSAAHLNMAAAGEDELARVWTAIDRIRAKQAAKPKHSPLPEQPRPAPAGFEAVAAAMRGAIRALPGWTEDDAIIALRPLWEAQAARHAAELAVVDS
jgi:hypothetical protein